MMEVFDLISKITPQEEVMKSNYYSDFQTIQVQDIEETTDGALNIVFETDNSDIKSEFKLEIEHNATEDESMAVEALRQLGNIPRIETKTPQDLPLLNCTTCELKFRTTADLQNHMSICKVSSYECQMCNAIFGRANDLNNHLVCHAVEKTHSCQICSSVFAQKKDLVDHMAMHSNVMMVNQCQVCGSVFSRPSSLTNHMKIHSYQPGRAILQSVYIENGSEALPSITNWIDDFGNDPLHAMNLDVGQNVIVEGNLEEINTPSTSKDSQKKPHACEYCGKKFTREKALNSHLKLHVNVSDNIFQCERCDQCFTAPEALSNHSCTKASPKKTFKHVCNQCGKKFSTKQKLYRHDWIHRKKTFACETCHKTFEKHEELDQHRLSTHQASSLYICLECGKSFCSRQGLWEHGRLHNPLPHVFKCVICLKTFTSRQGYHIHKRIHSDERPYGCRFCLKAFRDGGTLRKHEMIHTGERPHVCPICLRAFNQKVVLREHIRWLHANGQDGNYDCELCDEKLSEKNELCAHIIRHSDKLASLAKEGRRKKVKKAENDVTDMIELLDEITEDRLISCDLCADRFVNEEELSRHIKVHIE